jgi:homocysteine S-methyltransferase
MVSDGNHFSGGQVGGTAAWSALLPLADTTELAVSMDQLKVCSEPEADACFQLIAGTLSDDNLRLACYLAEHANEGGQMMGQSELPQMNNRDMTCGGGFETWLQYVDGFELRHFCGFELLNDERGVSCLTDFQRKHVEAAVANGFGVINEGLHYRASRDWGELIGFSREGLEEINIRGIEFYKDFAREYGSPETPMLVGGVIGPRGDAYNVGRTPDAAEAEDYHSEQILTFKKAGADLVSALTFSSVEEAIGLTRAAKAADMPVVISFFVAKG